MEDRLKNLIEGNSEANRIKWALEYKKQGKKIIGVMSSYVPEEAITAAGMLPWRITGTGKENISRARVYRAESNCAYCTHVLESILSGELDFLDGIVVTDIDQDLLRFWDVLVYLKAKPYLYAVHVPFADSDINVGFLRDEIRRFISSLENFGGMKIDDSKLSASISTYNTMRNQLWQMYELRKKEVPPLSGAEVLGITLAAQIMPKEQFNQDLKILLPYLKERKTSLKYFHPRLLITSEMLDNPAYLNVVEENCLIAMDDMDTGSRYFFQEVDTSLNDPAQALAIRYLRRHGAPSIATWDRQIEQLIKWVKEFNIDGVLGLPLTWCYNQSFRMPFLQKKFDEAKIPYISFDREYYLANVGQLRTRIGAFLELVNDKRVGTTS